eukprot:CAMPEP_0174370970 /NCGR_PEP_ID=MMETSP0811_2-20130205/98030_1 /TAXON_ID=73025 ORGANISM="Eutreptiella gymnastica-like, Strain CCMP1594" /NCGR_SAMPLE_ID=MMETSP0811_2 /ASSEMBLY_ACC=CAM_ASM_000667 /LENGTH=51 /DNA_ID=CAMNT_0015516907 /DNA_START=51 /DNA_END=206 /DNA_ORIENTATION=+
MRPNKVEWAPSFQKMGAGGLRASGAAPNQSQTMTTSSFQGESARLGHNDLG